MSDVLLTRIAVSLESIAANKSSAGAVPAKPATGATGAATTKPGASGKPAATGTKPNPAAGKKNDKPAAGPSGDTKGPGGQTTQDEVRALVRQVTTSCGKQEALDILDSEGGVQNVSALKPEDYDKVAEACRNAIAGDGGGEAGDEADPPA